MHAMCKAVNEGGRTWLGIWLIAAQIYTYWSVGVRGAAITWRQQCCQLHGIGTCPRGVGVTTVRLCYTESYLCIEEQTCSRDTDVWNKTWLKYAYMGFACLFGDQGRIVWFWDLEKASKTIFLSLLAWGDAWRHQQWPLWAPPKPQGHQQGPRSSKSCRNGYPKAI